MEASGPRLKALIGNRFYYGIKTGLNEAFVVDEATRDALVSEEAASAEVIKPLLVGNDVRRYEVRPRRQYLLYMRRGVDAQKYRAVLRHLEPFRARLERRAARQEWFELQQSQHAYARSFGRPKIIYPDIGKEPRFAMDSTGGYGNDTTFVIPVADWYLLAVLNSAPAWWYVTNTVAGIRGGYVRFKAQHLGTLPIPDAPRNEREGVAGLARRTQELHAERRRLAERFLRECGARPAHPPGRELLERPWALDAREFARRAPRADPELFRRARAETADLTARILGLEREIDERVAALYGLGGAGRGGFAPAASVLQSPPT